MCEYLRNWTICLNAFYWLVISYYRFFVIDFCKWFWFWTWSGFIMCEYLWNQSIIHWHFSVTDLSKRFNRKFIIIGNLSPRFKEDLWYTNYQNWTITHNGTFMFKSDIITSISNPLIFLHLNHTNIIILLEKNN